MATGSPGSGRTARSAGPACFSRDTGIGCPAGVAGTPNSPRDEPRFRLSKTGPCVVLDNRTIGIIPAQPSCLEVKARLAGLLIVSLLALAGGIGVASAVSFDQSYADPASDVVELWASNMTPVLTDGNLTLSPFPDSVNVLRLSSADAGADIALTIQVKGSIADLDNTSSQARIYTREDNSTHFRATYVNGKMMLTSNATGFVPIDISPRATVTQGTLTVNVAKSWLGTITAWELDTTATETGTIYSYRDSGWQIAGNPGSEPTLPGGPSVLANWAWIAVVPVAIAIATVVVMVLRERKRGSAGKLRSQRDEVPSFHRRGKP